MEPDDIERELFKLARDWMSVFKLRTRPDHVEKDPYVALWKQFSDYTQRKGSIMVRLFRCQLRHRC